DPGDAVDIVQRVDLDGCHGAYAGQCAQLVQLPAVDPGTQPVRADTLRREDGGAATFEQRTHPALLRRHAFSLLALCVRRRERPGRAETDDVELRDGGLVETDEYLNTAALVGELTTAVLERVTEVVFLESQAAVGHGVRLRHRRRSSERHTEQQQRKAIAHARVVAVHGN